MNLFGEISALITAIFWSCSSILFTEASKRIGSIQLNINRLIMALVLLGVTVTIAGIGPGLNFNQIILLSVSGVVGLIFGDGFLFKSFAVNGARISMLMMASVPAMTTIIGILFLEETISLTGILGIAITLSGILLVLYDKKEGEEGRNFHLGWKGVFYGAMGALGQACGLLFAKAAFKIGDIDGFTATLIRIYSSVIIFVPFMILAGRYKNPVKLYSQNIKALWFTIGGSIFGPFLGITFSLLAIKNTNIGIASTLMATVPVMMLPIVRIVYKEKLTIRSIIGSVIAVLGVSVLFLL